VLRFTVCETAGAKQGIIAVSPLRAH